MIKTLKYPSQSVATYFFAAALLLFGFMGSAYYLVPEEAETELYSPKLAEMTGIRQVWLQRMAANPTPFMAMQEQSNFFYWVRLGGGVGFLLGLITCLSSFFIGGE